MYIGITCQTIKLSKDGSRSRVFLGLVLVIYTRWCFTCFQIWCIWILNLWALWSLFNKIFNNHSVFTVLMINLGVVCRTDLLGCRKLSWRGLWSQKYWAKLKTPRLYLDLVYFCFLLYFCQIILVQLLQVFTLEYFHF